MQTISSAHNNHNGNKIYVASNKCNTKTMQHARLVCSRSLSMSLVHYIKEYNKLMNEKNKIKHL